MATLYNLNPSKNSVNGFGLPFCADTYTSTLAANTEATLTIPGFNATGIPSAATYNKFIAVFSYEAAKNVYVSVNSTAAVPAGATLAASTSELNPPAKLVKKGDVIHVICADGSTDISIALYSVQE
jgi:hypothetical protein